MNEAMIVLGVVGQIAQALVNLATAKTAADRTAAFAAMKTAITEGEAQIAALPSQLAANDAAVDARADAKFPPAPRGDEPTVDLKHGALKPIDDLK